ncbi:hypothetical protein NE237_008066 [Protea cynaroides]|uniref:Uncharacterized protein n=1 Tax=Protea cynaroides TaxID=273540 RepID=A0A9Q0QX07_9MAGN|nr:hypothetical protein NE237_008066 [Protea cynaroides]
MKEIFCQKFKKRLKQHIHVNHIAPALLILLSLTIPTQSSNAHHCAVVESKYWNSRIEEHKFSKLQSLRGQQTSSSNKLLEQRKTSIQCLAVHPGVVPAFQKKAFWMFDPAEGARSVLFCATSADVVAHLVKGFAYYSSDMDACMEVWQKTMEILKLDVDYLSNMYDNLD